MVQIPAEPEVAKKAVKSKQISFEGKAVTDETNECFFCGEAVDVYGATITKQLLGHVVCFECSVKVIAVVSYAGTRCTS